MLFRATSLALAGALLLVAGCSGSRLNRFPDFPAHKARLGSSVVIADFLVLRATADSVPTVDLGATKSAADTLLSFVQRRLDAKGYGVTNHLLTSAGLSMDSTFTANVTNTSGFDREGDGSPMSIHPPFYLYQALRRDPGMRTLLGALYRRLARMEEADGGYPPAPEAVPLGRAFGGGLLFVLLGGGFEVSASVEQLGTPPPWLEGEAKIGYKAVTQGSLNLYILDSGTGDVLWTDRQTTTGGLLYDDKFIRMAGIVLEDLP